MVDAIIYIKVVVILVSLHTAPGHRRLPPGGKEFFSLGQKMGGGR